MPSRVVPTCALCAVTSFRNALRLSGLGFVHTPALGTSAEMACTNTVYPGLPTEHSGAEVVDRVQGRAIQAIASKRFTVTMQQRLYLHP